MFSIRYCLFVSSLILSLCYDSAASAKELPHLTWRGCGISKKAFMRASADSYEQQTGVHIRLSGGGAGLGIEAAGTGGADMGGTCRQFIDSQNEHQLGLKLIAVAWDALAIVVHPSNPVNDMSHDQIKRILRQEITNWKQLDGPDAPIVVVGRRGKTSGVGYSTRQLILGSTDAEYGPTVVRLNSSGPVEKLVERQPFAIAVTGISSAKKRQLKVLSIDGTMPSVPNIATGNYPFVRPLFIAYKPGTRSDIDDFIHWLISEDGQAVIEGQGTVSLRQGAKLFDRFAHMPTPKQIENYAMLKKLAGEAVEE